MVSAAQTWYVDDDGGANFTKIQDAVNNAFSYETIIVRDGIYTENIDVTVANLTIRSENGSENCIIQATNISDHVFEVTADYVNISEFTVTGARGTWAGGIFLYLVDHCSILDINTADNDIGIYLRGSSNTLTNNIANSNKRFGIILYESSNNNTVTHNTAYKNSYDGIILSDSRNNTIIGNNAFHNSRYGIYFHDSSDYNTITDNHAYNNSNGIVLSSSRSNNLTNNYAYNNSLEGILLISSSNNNSITANHAYQNNVGIYLRNSSANLICNNYFNNTINAYDNDNNIWNISKTAGTNIIGGPYLGGNYWNVYTGNDVDCDGIGDTPYDILGGANWDYLPLVNISGLQGSISGKVTYTCNTTGIAGATVNLTRKAMAETLSGGGDGGGVGVINSTVTNSNGEYTFTNVFPGDYEVNASKVHFWDNATDVTVTAGASTEADMMLWLKGDVLDIYDIIMLRQAAAENIPWDYRYDLYVDDNVDIYDIIVLRQAVAGNIVLE
jgi:parallel beta-helix repeat protein